MTKIVYVILIFFACINLNAQARLIIENNSQRQMKVKIMKKGSVSSLYEIIEISSYKNYTVYFHESGNYYTKTKATIKGKDPICKKSQTFNVVNDERGYSILTLTFTIKETKNPISSGGQTISNMEFEKD
jgi:tetrahydromethanopterin S-methyltransferase subunit D